MDYISSSCKAFDVLSRSDKFSNVEDILKLCTELTSKVRAYHTSQKKRLDSLSVRPNTLVCPDKAISSCKTNMYTSAIWIRKCLKCCMELMQMMATLQDNVHLFKSITEVNVNELQNARLLFDATYVSKHIDPKEYPNLIRKYSDIWYELTFESFVTSDTIFKSLGFAGFALMRQHFKKFINEEHDINITKKNDYDHLEKNTISTLCCTLMASLLPSCAVFYEEGCTFVDGKLRQNMVWCTQLGMIR